MKKLIIFNLIIFFIIFSVIFYKGSINADIWGKWQDFEIVFPIMISFFLAVIFMTPVMLIEFLLQKRKNNK